MNKDHFYRGTFTTYIHFIYSAVHYSGLLYVYFQNGGVGGSERRGFKREEKRSGPRKGQV